ncbi:HNH endonuclease [Photobacterium damselae]|uniref:HNH endonuclease n=1 Tax=Photobacterium damselae TaxID=38293 RepID=UPI001F2E26A9|nr:HNH endonuclease [Photobacterium damselae]UKA11389.1 HNH endonuclease [Photobacterium damselae subsp. damselae]
MNICYLTGEQINESNKSLEHIIPNALGGVLTHRYVLTHDSNQKLNSDIDEEFNSIFESVHQRIALKKDRGKLGGIKAFHRDFGKNIIVRNGKCYPIEPFFDSKTNIVYAKDNKMGVSYSKYIARKENVEADLIKVVTDMTGQFEVKFGFDNSIFKKGLAKIAAGFATYHGVSRDNLCGIIDLNNNKFKDDILIAPYLPTTNEESYFEENIHNSNYYTMHSLVLFGNSKDKLLYCYVELFSTYQYFIILNDNYEGDDIYKNYFHSLSENTLFDYFDYKKSIPNSDDLSKLLPDEYRKYSKCYIQSMNNNLMFDLDLVKAYTHFKMNTLYSYINHINIKTKLNY